MNKTRLSLLLGMTCGLAPLVYAAPVCNSTDVCERPDFNSTTDSGWSVSASVITLIKCLNSVGPNGNQASSNYFFAATTADFGSFAANGAIKDSGDGSTVLGNTPTHNGTSTNTSTVTGGEVQGTKGNTSYWVYAQACPSGTAPNGANCSPWSKIETTQTTTSKYPTSVFSNPQKGTDAKVNTINVRTSVPLADVHTVSLIYVTIIDSITPANNLTLSPTTYSGNSAPYTIDNSLFTNGFKPNNKYLYQGQVQYPWDVVPTAGAQTVGSFWTTPENPGPVTASNITHCSAKITAQNSNVSTPNPTYTEYSLCAGAVCNDSQATGRIGGTPVASDTISATISGLSPSTTYTPKATALVGDQDFSQAGWNNSGVTNGSNNFTTLSWGGPFSVTGVFNTSATFTISVTSGASISSWQIQASNGSILLSSGTADPTGTQTANGLTPNTVYKNLQITLTEPTGCSSTLSITPSSFTTTPYAPTAGTGTALDSGSIQANWTDASANGAGTQYQVEYCQDAGFSVSCLTKNASKVSGSAQSATLTGLTEEQSYYLHVKTLNLTQPAGTYNADSAYFVFTNNPTATSNAAPVITALSCAPGSTTANCSVTATDNSSTLKYAWSSPSAGVTFSPNNADGSGGSASNTTATFPAAGNYTITATVTDHDGSGLSTSSSTTVNAGQNVSTISVSPASTTLATGNSLTFNATVTDQFGTVENGQPVNWSVSGGGNLSTAIGSSTTFTATTPGNNFTLTASAGGATGQASINVVAAGPYFVNQPAITLSTKTGTLTASGNDNVTGTTGLTYTWALVNGPASVSFDVNNGTVNGSAVTVTFTAAGTYTFSCTLNNTNGSAVADTPAAALSQFLSAIVVTPNNVTINLASSQQFNAAGLDQFGGSMPPLSGVSWNTVGGGNVSQAGVFQSLSSGNNLKVTATKSGISGSATVNVINFDVSGAHAYPVPFKSTRDTVINFTGLGTDAKIRIYTTSGRLVFNTHVATDTYPWNVKNNAGENLASGVYFFVIESPAETKDGKLIIIQ